MRADVIDQNLPDRAQEGNRSFENSCPLPFDGGAKRQAAGSADEASGDREDASAGGAGDDKLSSGCHLSEDRRAAVVRAVPCTAGAEVSYGTCSRPGD